MTHVLILLNINKLLNFERRHGYDDAETLAQDFYEEIREHSGPVLMVEGPEINEESDPIARLESKIDGLEKLEWVELNKLKEILQEINAERVTLGGIWENDVTAVQNDLVGDFDVIVERDLVGRKEYDEDEEEEDDDDGYEENEDEDGDYAVPLSEDL